MISFIVPAHNEAPLIASTLHALRAAAEACSEAFEILVVDDASDDDTGAIAAACGARVLRVECRHIAATRNAGAALAEGDTLCFVDADTQVDATVLGAALRALREGAVGGGARVRLQEPVGWHVRVAAAFFAWAFRLTGVAPGCFQFCTRAAFEAVGGYDERYYAGEDVAMSRALARVGRVAILREPVATSARKVRTFSAREQWALAWRFAWRGRRLLASREHLDLWYGKRRH